MRKKPAPAASKSVARQDGWSNVLSGLGMKGDKTKHTRAAVPRLLQNEELGWLYAGDGMGARIVNVVADDALHRGWEIVGDKDGKLAKECARLGFKKHFTQAMRWTRLYKGAIIVMDTDGGGEIDKPMKKGAKLRGLRVYPASRVRLDYANIGTDPSSPWFEDFERFNIQKMYGGEFVVHHTRCLVFKGVQAPPDLLTGDMELQYWGMSALQQIIDGVAMLGSTFQSVGNILMELIIGKYTIPELANLVAENNAKAIHIRMEAISACKSILKSVLLGEGEKYERDTVSLAGMSDAIDRVFMYVSGMTGIPVTKLFGRSAAGMNATGEGDANDYDQLIQAVQEFQVHDPMLYAIRVLNAGMGSPVNDAELEIKFNARSPSQKDLVEMRSKQATTDKTYIEIGVLTPDEVKQSRFGGNASFETTVGDTKAPGVAAE